MREEVQAWVLPVWFVVGMALSLLTLGFVLGRAYTLDDYREPFASCPYCDGRGVVTTREAVEK